MSLGNLHGSPQSQSQKLTTGQINTFLIGIILGVSFIVATVRIVDHYRSQSAWERAAEYMSQPKTLPGDTDRFR